jgi:hypothetical protein
MGTTLIERAERQLSDDPLASASSVAEAPLFARTVRVLPAAAAMFAARPKAMETNARAIFFAEEQRVQTRWVWTRAVRILFTVRPKWVG